MAVAEQVVSESALTLDELAEAGNREHSLIQQFGQSMIECAIRAGDVLLEAKRQVPYGGWMQWIDDNCTFSQKTARNYLRCARNQDIIRDLEITSIERAVKVLERIGRTCADPATVAAIKQLRAEGWSYAKLAQRFDISSGTAHRYANLDAQRRRDFERQTVARRRRRDEAIKARGGSISDAYRHVRLALEALQKALDDAERGEAKREINSAMARLYNVEDAIGRAVKLS